MISHTFKTYRLLITSVIAGIGLFLSSQVRPRLSFLAHAFTCELVMYYILLAWIVISLLALITKLMLDGWQMFAGTRQMFGGIRKASAASPSIFTQTCGYRSSFWKNPQAERFLTLVSYIVVVFTLVLVVDRIGMGFVSSLEVALHADHRPKNDELALILYFAWQGRSVYASGVFTTVGLAVFGTLIAFVLALVLVFIRIQQHDRQDNDAIRFFKSLGSGFARVYSTVVRGTPMMVQAGIIYYGGLGLMQLSGLTITQINGIWSYFVAGLVTVSLNSTAYMMEVLRGGIESVDSGQMEAARALGLSQWQAMRKVVFPQGIKFAIPGLSNELVINIKDSSVLSVIGVFDLMFATQTIAGQYWSYTENYIIAAIIYLLLTMMATRLLNQVAKHLQVDSVPLMGTSDTVVHAS